MASSASVTNFEDVVACVVDVGSLNLRVGRSGEDAPTVTRSQVGGKKTTVEVVKQQMVDGKMQRVVVKEEVMKGSVSPVHKRIVQDLKSYEAMGALLADAYRSESLTPDESPLILSDGCLAPTAQREKLTQIVFEEVNACGFYLKDPPTSIAYASGRLVALSVSVGHTVSFGAPLYEGYMLPHAVTTAQPTGSTASEVLREALRKAGGQAAAVAQVTEEALVKLKKAAKVSLSSADGKKGTAAGGGPTEFELPDGNKVKVSKEELTRAANSLFEGSSGKDDDLVSTVAAVVSKVDIDIRRDMYKNIVLAGGGSLFGGLPVALQAKLAEAAPKYTVKVVAPPDRHHSIWLGMSILASLTSSARMYITKAEYDETGPVIVHRKCF